MHQGKARVWLEFQRTSSCGAGCPAAAACCRSSAAKASPLGTLRQAKMTAGQGRAGRPGIQAERGRVAVPGATCCITVRQQRCTLLALLCPEGC